ncbi:MAG: hypothetical protein HOU81_08580 [Hamadaea sp.]|uniref:hypothetical protein n=1 Tax=Hamadaea sp. TaxID=2024425 RepID=UPI00178F28FB|nr:hypothetical protein [Hamadaea sp.]NUR70864.1 hypothetical protein [Hamadaea sp.]NUT20881.1 hypothetical protein [Hamadaea sp.]
MFTNGGLRAAGIWVQDARAGHSASKIAEVVPGKLLSIGSCVTCPLDVRLSWHARFHVRLSVGNTMWAVTNQSRRADVTIEDLEDPLQRVICQPHRRDVVIPFEMARLRISGHSALIVSAPEPVVSEDDCCIEGSRGRSAELETKVYFLATVIMCSVRLRRGLDSPLLTQREIAEHLGRLGHRLEPRTVRSYLDYFADRLGLPGAGGPARGWRRELLARTVITQGLVRQEHLRLVRP